MYTYTARVHLGFQDSNFRWGWGLGAEEFRVNCQGRNLSEKVLALRHGGGDNGSALFSLY